jgi:hypothetical protein
MQLPSVRAREESVRELRRGALACRKNVRLAEEMFEHVQHAAALDRVGVGRDDRRELQRGVSDAGEGRFDSCFRYAISEAMSASPIGKRGISASSARPSAPIPARIARASVASE